MASFLQTELDLADTLLDIAQTTASKETRGRTFANARTAYDNALTFKGYIDDLPESEHRKIWVSITRTPLFHSAIAGHS